MYNTTHNYRQFLVQQMALQIINSYPRPLWPFRKGNVIQLLLQCDGALYSG